MVRTRRTCPARLAHLTRLAKRFSRSQAGQYGRYWARSSTAVDSLPTTRDDFLGLLQALLATGLDQEGPPTTPSFRGGNGQELDKERSGSSSEVRSVARLLRLVADALDPGAQS